MALSDAFIPQLSHQVTVEAPLVVGCHTGANFPNTNSQTLAVPMHELLVHNPSVFNELLHTMQVTVIQITSA